MIPIIAVLTDIVLNKSIKQHLNFSLVLAIIPALFIYLIPFLLSNYFSDNTYHENGLYLVYKENVLRYFKPFDHQGPIYTYFIYLPVYLIPWAIFLPPALWTLPKRWSGLCIQSKWIVWTVFLIFIFFTLSGSRRSYYILPLIPFAILLIADWLLSNPIKFENISTRLASFTVVIFLLLFFTLDIFPAWYYSQVGMDRFARLLKQDAAHIKPWNAWQFVMLDAESKLNFYLALPPTTKKFYMKGEQRENQTSQSLSIAWPILTNKPKDTIFISRKLYQPLLQNYFPDYHILEMPSSSFSFSKKHDLNAPIAFVPNQS